jgi:hypothetical protein
MAEERGAEGILLYDNRNFKKDVPYRCSAARYCQFQLLVGTGIEFITQIMHDMQGQHSRVTMPNCYLAAQPEAAVLLVLGLQLRGHVDSLQHKTITNHHQYSREYRYINREKKSARISGAELNLHVVTVSCYSGSYR